LIFKNHCFKKTKVKFECLWQIYWCLVKILAINKNRIGQVLFHWTCAWSVFCQTAGACFHFFLRDIPKPFSACCVACSGSLKININDSLSHKFCFIKKIGILHRNFCFWNYQFWNPLFVLCFLFFYRIMVCIYKRIFIYKSVLFTYSQRYFFYNFNFVFTILKILFFLLLVGSSIQN
jgi:hypothetical protein